MLSSVCVGRITMKIPLVEKTFSYLEFSFMELICWFWIQHLNPQTKIAVRYTRLHSGALTDWRAIGFADSQCLWYYLCASSRTNGLIVIAKECQVCHSGGSQCVRLLKYINAANETTKLKNTLQSNVRVIDIYPPRIYGMCGQVLNFRTYENGKAANLGVPICYAYALMSFRGFLRGGNGILPWR